MPFGGQPVELNNTEYKFEKGEVYTIRQFRESIKVGNFCYYTPPDSGVSNSNNKYINNLSNRTRAWQPNDDKRWKSYTSTKTGGAKADIYPASFSVVFALYLFLPMLVDLNTVENTFKDESREIFQEIENMYYVYEKNNGLYETAVSTLLEYLMRHAYDMNLYFMAKIEQKLNTQISNSILLSKQLINVLILCLVERLFLSTKK